MSSTELADLPALLIAGLFDTLWLTNRRLRLVNHKQLRSSIASELGSEYEFLH